MSAVDSIFMVLVLTGLVFVLNKAYAWPLLDPWHFHKWKRVMKEILRAEATITRIDHLRNGAVRTTMRPAMAIEKLKVVQAAIPDMLVSQRYRRKADKLAVAEAVEIDHHHIVVEPAVTWIQLHHKPKGV